jgi:hypothetical protein
VDMNREKCIECAASLFCVTATRLRFFKCVGCHRVHLVRMGPMTGRGVVVRVEGPPPEIVQDVKNCSYQLLGRHCTITVSSQLCKTCRDVGSKLPGV